MKVHRLVLLAFVGPRPDGMECLHGPDPTKSNNAITNIRWGTRQENERESKLRSSRRRLNPDHLAQVYAMRAKGSTFKEIGDALGVPKWVIRDAFNGLTWKYVDRSNFQ